MSRSQARTGTRVDLRRDDRLSDADQRQRPGAPSGERVRAWPRCAVDTASTTANHRIRIEVPDTGHTLVELLTHVALSATKAGIDLTEPLCEVASRHVGASSEVKLAFRVAEFSIDTTAPNP